MAYWRAPNRDGPFAWVAGVDLARSLLIPVVGFESLETENMMRAHLVMLICSLVFCFAACSKDRASDEDGNALEQALRAVGEAAESHALANDGIFPATSAPIYCRGGGTVTDEDSVFTTIGFQPGDNLESADFCFNVSGDRKQVALSVSENPLAEEVLCLVIDLSGDEPVWSEVTSTASCRP